MDSRKQRFLKSSSWTMTTYSTNAVSTILLQINLLIIERIRQIAINA